MKRYIVVLMLLIPILLSPMAFAATSLQIQTGTVPQTVTPGNEVYVEVKITNTGVLAIDSVKIKGLTVDPNIVQVTPVYLSDLGSLGPSKMVSTLIKFKVPTITSSGFYPIAFLIDACQGNTCDGYTASALVTVQAPSALEIKSVTPTSLTPGENNTLAITLSNVGDTAISSILLTWTDPTNKILPLGSDNRKFISSINKNSDYMVTSGVIVSPDAASGVYPITISMDYKDQTGAPQHIVSTVGLRVVGNYHFVVSLETQDIVTAGMKGSAEIKIANAGTQDAQFLTVKVMQSDPIAQITPSVVYVGNLKSNDYDTEKFQFYAANATPGMYALKIELTYKDPYGQSYSEVRSVDVRVSSKSEVQSPSSLPLIVVVVIVVIAVYIYWDFRRKKKKERR